MNYLAQCYAAHITGELDKYREAPLVSSPKMLFTIPDLPEGSMLAVAGAIHAATYAAPDVQLTLKVASVVADTWSDTGKDTLRSMGWYDEHGNLTHYRNLPAAPNKCHIIILCGADRVTDASSLADFHRCDPATIWESEMKWGNEKAPSFKGWIMQKLQASGFTDISEKDLSTINRILTPIFACGRGDLISIDNWLSKQDFSHLDSVAEVPGYLLANLQDFGLPVLARFPIRTRKRLEPYINKAEGFFNYNLFMEPSPKKKAIEAVAGLRESLDEGEPLPFTLDDDVIGPYQSAEAFLEGLIEYIRNENSSDRARLLRCDFVFISDKILKFKKAKTNTKKKDTPHFLHGNPVEVLLSALWQSLKEFSKSNRHEDERRIEHISIIGRRFKHNQDDSSDNEETAELAENYLQRLLGGIDELVKDQVLIAGPDGEDIAISCSIINSEMTCPYSSTAEPALEFDVEIQGGLEPFKRHFVWLLPDHHQFRLSVDLLKLASEKVAASSELYNLPVFHLLYYEELLNTSSEHEIRQILLHAIQSAVGSGKVLTNLLSPEWVKMTDPLKGDLEKLALCYRTFLEEARSQGLFTAIFAQNGRWHDLRKAYQETMQKATAYVENAQSSMMGMLTRAFLVVYPRSVDLGESWHAETHESSGVATILHPSVLEMFQAQTVFLFHCFNNRVKEEIRRDQPNNAFKPFAWQRYVDLAAIQSPLVGLLDENDNLSTDVRGEGLVHRIGKAPMADALLSTRLKLQYGEDAGDERNFSDKEMFRESSESKQLTLLMLDYFRLHPHARDGLSIAVYRNKDIQPLIAAVHAYLKNLAKKIEVTDDDEDKRYILGLERQHPYAISVTLFTESPDESAAAMWVQQWRERWEAAETEKAYELYRYCRFSIAHRIIEQGDQGAFVKLIKEHFEADIAVLYDFVGACSGSSFEKVNEFDITSHKLMYPILEKACCSTNDPHGQYRRQRITSNRQFGLADKHANLLHSLRTKTSQPGTLVVATGVFNPWIELVNRLHEKAEWVVCIDPNMDERLIKPGDKTSGNKRDIIGFGSGVGNQGEDNYTISTEAFTLENIQRRVSQAIKELYVPEASWTPDECKESAEKIIATASTLSGLSLVRATGVHDNYIHDFMAYALSRMMLQSGEGESLLCETLVSLDAYRHWFDLAENNTRPDLMWLQVAIKDDGRLHVRIQLVECKLGSKPSDYVNKAQGQIDNGLLVLAAAFAPNTAGSEQRPDKRYWWMQLHRLIACKTEVERGRYQAARDALERLAEGDFKLSWAASVFLFGINGEDEIRRSYYWPSAGMPGITGNVYEIGGGFVRRLCCGSDAVPIDWSSLNGQGEGLAAPSGSDDCRFAQDDYAANDDDEDDDDDSADDGAELAAERAAAERAAAERAAAERAAAERAAAERAAEKAAAEKAAADGEKIAGDGASTPASIVMPLPPSPQAIAPVIVSHPAGLVQVADFGATDETDIILPSSIKPAKILLGTSIPGDQPVYWEFNHPELPNRHMIIFGSSGQGKTYAIQAILCEMQKLQQHSLIVDYTNGFLPNQLEEMTQVVLHPTQHVVRNNPLPINPFLAQTSDDGGIEFTETPNNIAKRIAGLFDSVYAIGDQQYSCLHQVIMDGVARWGTEMDLEKMLAMLDELRESKESKSPALSLSNKLRPFVLDRPFASGPSSYNWDQLFSAPETLCNIFQLYGMDTHSGRLITEFILWDLYGFLQARGVKTNPKVIVLDEVQNLDHREDSPLAKYLREGRKFGISLMLATQSMSGMKADEITRMFLADQQLFFRPSDTEMKNFAKILSQIDRRSADEWIRRLSALGKGECYSIGQQWDPMRNKLVKKAVKIRITPLEERGFEC
ncbi:MAG: ATP-binding protein [Lentisphaerae bacterium]|nr:ATP-binding protein [Lentisphaerota bacterium]